MGSLNYITAYIIYAVIINIQLAMVILMGPKNNNMYRNIVGYGVGFGYSDACGHGDHEAYWDIHGLIYSYGLAHGQACGEGFIDCSGTSDGWLFEDKYYGI